jgi:prepilin peptidase CpaA
VPHDWSSLLPLSAATVLLAAAAHDIVARTVPNAMALLLALIGLAARAVDGTLVSGLVVAAATFLLAAFCWRRGWMGGGDVKLIGAASLAVPPATVLPFITAMSLAGAVLALLYLAGRRLAPMPRSHRPRTLPARALRAECWRIRRGGPLPYACAIAAGFLFVTLSRSAR